ncbi:MAG: type II toxin-antitoxin system prevent-host-death family antitoxin [Campylobacterota bacterium]|nr:type II toxin-antitoxin system prevent-host-death family antitoxin [Campylobacterota bacterium]
MQVVNFTEARNNLKSLFDDVYHNYEDVIVNRKNGENVVIISLDKYNSLNETEYLMRSPANKERLLKSITSLREGQGKDRELIEE